MPGFFDFLKNKGPNINSSNSNIPVTNNNLTGANTYAIDSNSNQGVIKNQPYSDAGPNLSGGQPYSGIGPSPSGGTPYSCLLYTSPSPRDS